MLEARPRARRRRGWRFSPALGVGHRDRRPTGSFPARVARPRVTRFDRIVLVALVIVIPTSTNVVRVVQPERTIQKTCGRRGPPDRDGSAGPAFLRNHAPEDLVLRLSTSCDVFFRLIFVFVFIELATRKVMLAATTRFPSQAWVTQQLRNATL